MRDTKWATDVATRGVPLNNELDRDGRLLNLRCWCWWQALVYVGQVVAKKTLETASLAHEISMATAALKAAQKLPLGAASKLDDLAKVGASIGAASVIALAHLVYVQNVIWCPPRAAEFPRRPCLAGRICFEQVTVVFNGLVAGLTAAVRCHFHQIFEATNLTGVHHGSSRCCGAGHA
jgi:hypothetical protein